MYFRPKENHLVKTFSRFTKNQRGGSPILMTIGLSFVLLFLNSRLSHFTQMLNMKSQIYANKFESTSSAQRSKIALTDDMQCSCNFKDMTVASAPIDSSEKVNLSDLKIYDEDCNPTGTTLAAPGNYDGYQVESIIMTNFTDLNDQYADIENNRHYNVDIIMKGIAPGAHRSSHHTLETVSIKLNFDKTKIDSCENYVGGSVIHTASSTIAVAKADIYSDDPMFPDGLPEAWKNPQFIDLSAYPDAKILKEHSRCQHHGAINGIILAYYKFLKGSELIIIHSGCNVSASTLTPSTQESNKIIPIPDNADSVEYGYWAAGSTSSLNADVEGDIEIELWR